MVTRKDITNCLMFLVSVMIVMNIYTLLIFWKTKFDKELENQKVREYGNIGKLPIRQRTINSERQNVDVTSVRFQISKDGKIRLLVPKELRNYDLKSVEKEILDKIKEERTPVNSEIQGTAYLERRWKRAFSRTSVIRNENDLIDGRLNPLPVWRKIIDWPNNIEKLVNDGSLGQILSFLSHVKVIQAKNSRRGTQLKLELILEGGEMAFFKPAWYPLDTQIRGEPYGGKDRHFGEVAAFYLAQLMGYNSGPIVVGRKLNLVNEILPYSTKQLNNTFFRNSGGELCFYGVCYYCRKQDPICSVQNEINGALILQMKQKFKLFQNPWRRTYKKNEFANWEKNMTYCQNVLLDLEPTKRTDLLLDIVAVSAFDFLIGNADRHHLDFFAGDPVTSGHVLNIALLDNGKSFGDSEEDYIDILAPLYQCCIIRNELWKTFLKFKGNLGKSLNSITFFDPLYPLLTQSHLTALNRRLNILISTVKMCLDRTNTTHTVIL